MKKFMFMMMAVFMTTALIGCSDEDEYTEIQAPANLDVSLLPGYWILVNGGDKQNFGVWISDQDDIVSTAMGKPVKFFRLPNGLNGPAKRIETTYWYLSDGVINIWTWEGRRTIMKLSKDKMTIMTTTLVGETRSETQQYERLSDPIEIEESIDF